MSQLIYTTAEKTKAVYLLTASEAANDSALTSLGIDVLIIAASGVTNPPNAKWIIVPVDGGLVPDYRIKSAVAPLGEFWRTYTMGLTDAVSGQREAAFLLACAVASDTSVSFATAWTEVESKLAFYEGYNHRLTDEMVAQGTSVYPAE